MTSSPKLKIHQGHLRLWLPSLIIVLVCAAAIWVLHREFRTVRYQDVRTALISLPASQILAALALTFINYAVLTGCDQLAFSHLGRAVSRWRVSVVAFIAYALSNSIGFAVLSGTSVRHRFYSRWGLRPPDLSRLVVFNTTIPWLGLLTLGGASLIIHPEAYASLNSAIATGASVIGVMMLAPIPGYAALVIFRRAPIRLFGVAFSAPSPGLALGQWLVSVLDWSLAAAVLYVLLPAAAPPYTALLGAFIAAQLLGLISHVPGGLGVFEGMMVLLLGDSMPVESLLAALLLYRLIYYVLPLVFALTLLLADALRQRRELVSRLTHSLGSLSLVMTPRILALLTFLAGVLLLASGVTPAIHTRLEWLSELLPLGLLEATHFVGSLVGVVLLLLSQALARRIRLAYVAVVIALCAGIALSLLKAADWEEASLLTGLLLALVPCRRFFDRQAALFDTRFSPAWIVAILAAFGGSIWLGFFAFRHVDYSNQLWWQFALNRDASRFLRASVGVAVTLAGFGVWRLLRPRNQVAQLPSPQDLDTVERVISNHGETLPFLAYTRDKALLFNADRNAFIMYGIQGRTWAALGDPVGPLVQTPGLIRTFLERADDLGALPVFYQVRPAYLHLYADVGLTFIKLGEEALLPLTDFSTQGRAFRDLRSVMNRMARDGITFRLLDRVDIVEMMPQLHAVSADWMANKTTGEKGFSVGFFNEDYLVRTPVAVLEQNGGVIAFANVLLGSDKRELSVDLMRFRQNAPNGVMDGLFTHLFFWGQSQGYQWFNLGMAPLSGIEPSPLPSLWSRVSRLIYGHGEAFYNFEGLRAYKEKFQPVWEPRYLAYPSGAGLPLILADIAALSAGGYVRIFR